MFRSRGGDDDHRARGDSRGVPIAQVMSVEWEEPGAGPRHRADLPRRPRSTEHRKSLLARPIPWFAASSRLLSCQPNHYPYEAQQSLRSIANNLSHSCKPFRESHDITSSRRLEGCMVGCPPEDLGNGRVSRRLDASAGTMGCVV